MFRYIKELVKDSLFSIKQGFRSMRISFKLNRDAYAAIKHHHKLVSEKGHCGAFLNEIENTLEFLSKEEQLKHVNSFIKWAETITEEYIDITPTIEEEWQDVLDYKSSLEN
jgi:Rad3-related DNA helicase